MLDFNPKIKKAVGGQQKVSKTPRNRKTNPKAKAEF